MKWHWPKFSEWSWTGAGQVLKSWKFWWKAAVVAVVLFVLLATLGSPILPGNLFYPFKRAGESVLSFLTPSVNFQHFNLKDGVRAIYAARRLNEAANMVERLDKRSAAKQSSDADTIEALLQQFGVVFSNVSVDLGQIIDRGDQPSVKIFTDLQKRSTQLAVKLQHLRLEAPPTDQAMVLRSIVVINNNLATISDALKQTPVSAKDSAELTKLVSGGLISKADLTTLLGQANSNRRLLDLLRERVKSGQLPSGIIYAMNFDLVTNLLPNEAATYIQSVRFDELRKVALLMKTIEPTPTQKTAINDYLRSYKAGDLVPNNSLSRYTVPLIYGWHLVESQGIDLGVIKVEHLSPERQIFYDLWAPYLTKTKKAAAAPSRLLQAALAQTGSPVSTQKAPDYDQILAAANIGLIKSSSLLDRVQLELLKATRSEVAYMALPPGWTATDVVMMSESFKQATTNLKASETVQAKTDQATSALATVTAPLQATDSTAAVEALRAETKTAIESLRSQLIQTAYNSTYTTVNNTTVVNQPVTNIDQEINTLRQEFSQKLNGLEAKLSADNQAALTLARQQLTDLKAATTDSLDRLSIAQTDLKDQVTAQAELVTSLKSNISLLETGQTTLVKDISTARQATTDLTKAAATNLDAAIKTANQLQADNLTNLQTQLTNQVSRAGALELALVGTVQAQAEQTAALQAEINLSATDRAALKLQLNQTVQELTVAEAKNLTDLTAAISAAEARGQTQITEVKQAVAALTTSQAETVQALQSLSDDKDLLRSQVVSAITEVKAVQAATTAAVQKLTTDQSALLASVQAIGSQQATALTQLQTQSAETAAVRTQLTQAVSDLTVTQAASSQDLHNAVLALGSELTQSIGIVAATQSQAQVRLDLVEGKTLALSAAIDLNKQTSLQVQADLAAEIAQTKTLQQELGQSLAALTQAQLQTAASVLTLQTDVTAVKQSVADIKAVQLATNAKVDGLLAASVDWSNLAASVQVDVTALNNLQTSLNADFAAKSAALQLQFESYQQHLNADINRLGTETDAQILRLQQEAARLTTQLQQLQTTTTTPTSTPSTPGL